MRTTLSFFVLPFLVACGSQHPIVGKWEVESGGGKSTTTESLAGMGDMLEGMRVFIFKKDGAGSVRLGTANEPFGWQIEGDTLTRTAKKTTAILKQRVMKSTFRIEGDKLILNESGKEIILRRK